MLPYIFIILGILSRLLPHPPNFTPIAAIALFSGAYLNKRQAIFLPLTIMILSDIIIGLHDVIAWTWGSFFLVGLLGIWLKSHKTPPLIIGTVLLSSVLFFLITNFGVWFVGNWYPKTLEGLITCFVAALPFFRNTLVGDFTYVTLFFGAYEMAQKLIEKKAFFLLKK